MSDLTDLSDAIAERALQNTSTTNDGVTVTRRSLKELDDHYDRAAARQANTPALRAAQIRSIMFKVVPPGGH